MVSECSLTKIQSKVIHGRNRGALAAPSHGFAAALILSTPHATSPRRTACVCPQATQTVKEKGEIDRQSADIFAVNTHFLP